MWLSLIKGTETFVDSLESMIDFLDEPIADPAALNTLMICKAAKKYKGSALWSWWNDILPVTEDMLLKDILIG